jgi:hypothetical protein
VPDGWVGVVAVAEPPARGLRARFAARASGFRGAPEARRREPVMPAPVCLRIGRLALAAGPASRGIGFRRGLVRAAAEPAPNAAARRHG